MGDFWENVDRCDYCSSDKFSHYMTSSVPKWFKGEPLSLHECDNCGLVVASPRPMRLAIYQDYLKGEKNAEAAVDRKLARPNVMNVHTKAVEHAINFLDHKPTSLFDMGCGAGTIMEAAKTLGLEASGNDINLAGVRRLEGLGFKAYHGFTKDLDIPLNTFDIVINFDYLEHSYEPYEDLVKCNEILKNGGILYLKTLYLDCPDHILKGDGYQLFGQGHFSYFRARTLLSMIYSAGFDIVDLRLGGLIFVTAKKTRAPNKVPINRYKHVTSLLD